MVSTHSSSRPGVILGEVAFDVPKQLLAALLVGLLRLRREQLIHLAIAITVPVEARTTGVEQVDCFAVGVLAVSSFDYYCARAHRDYSARGFADCGVRVELDRG